MNRRKQPPRSTLVIFGANGDLTHRLIIPALYNLARQSLLPDKFAILGIDHNDQTTESWRNGLYQFIADLVRSGGAEFEDKAIDENVWGRLARSMNYAAGDFLDPQTYKRLAEALANGGNVLFYLATADRFFSKIAERLGQAGLVKQTPTAFRRVVVEKPFGHDLESAKKLNACLLDWMDESQIYRIDHFLGKETVQNIMALRFANGLFEPIWNRDRIDHVQITVSETIGIGTRGKFYEQTGALRDMVPNHLFQLVAMTAMEPPVSFDAEAVRDKRGELFEAIHPVGVKDVVRGQYGEGREGKAAVAGYRHEHDVAADSSVETYVAMKVGIDNWRWGGVPFYLRTGKRLSARKTEIAIRFKQAPYAIFRDTPVEKLGADWLILKIQPDEGIRLHFNAKRPGPSVSLENVAMDFHYTDWFREAPAVGYETLIYDCLMGDATLFQRADQVEGAWRLVDPVLREWSSASASSFPDYAAGSDGPSAADDLLARDHRAWRAIA